MAQHPIPRTAFPYQPINTLEFVNVTSPNAMGRPTPIPVTTYGDISLPVFNKRVAGALPSAIITIRGMIRGNTA